MRGCGIASTVNVEVGELQLGHQYGSFVERVCVSRRRGQVDRERDDAGSRSGQSFAVGWHLVDFE